MRHLAVAAIAFCLGATSAAAQERADLLVRHATIVDVEPGRLIEDHAVATRGDSIVAVGRDGDMAKAWRAKAMIVATSRLAGLEYALKRIDDQEFGYCIDCGEEIPLPRLLAMPQATHCVDCAG